MATNKKGGARTPEYEAFRRNFSALTEGILPALRQVATKALDLSIISIYNLSAVRNEYRSPYDRSMELLQIFLGKIELDKEFFYKIVDIFSNIPEMNHLAELLQTQVSKPEATICPSSKNEATTDPKLYERPNHGAVFQALYSIADKWKSIGTLLGLPPGKLSCIEADYSKSVDRMREMVSAWLNGTSANWKMLIDAVKRVDSERASAIEGDVCRITSDRQ